MITSVTFDRRIPVDMNRRIDRFATVDGWSIVEVEPGRVSLIEVLRTPGSNIIVQDVPYTLSVEAQVTEAPAAVEDPPSAITGKRRGRP